MSISREQYPCDVDRIVKVFRERGYRISRKTAQQAWRNYSDAYCSSWLFLPDEDETVFATVMHYANHKVEE